MKPSLQRSGEWRKRCVVEGYKSGDLRQRGGGVVTGRDLSHWDIISIRTMKTSSNIANIIEICGGEIVAKKGTTTWHIEHDAYQKRLHHLFESNAHNHSKNNEHIFFVQFRHSNVVVQKLFYPLK